jgi:hypothetical protein
MLQFYTSGKRPDIEAEYKRVISEGCTQDMEIKFFAFSKKSCHLGMKAKVEEFEIQCKKWRQQKEQKASRFSCRFGMSHS